MRAKSFARVRTVLRPNLAVMIVITHSSTGACCNVHLLSTSLLIPDSCNNGIIKELNKTDEAFYLLAHNPTKFSWPQIQACSRHFFIQDGPACSYCPDTVEEQGGTCPPGTFTVLFAGRGMVGVQLIFRCRTPLSLLLSYSADFQISRIPKFQAVNSTTSNPTVHLDSLFHTAVPLLMDPCSM
jgi:hypothetical protein